MLILDEAQNLVQRTGRGAANYEAFEWFRALAEDGCFALVFSGDLKLLKARDELPQLKRRVRRPVIIRRVPETDVAALANRRGLTCARTIEALCTVARHHGALGDVTNVIDHAKLFAGQRPVELAHVIAAIEDLKLTPKGAR